MKGLEAVQKQFTPENKTNPGLVRVILNIISNNPAFGPREISYRLQAMGYRISESGVYNVMRRENLSTKAQRVRFSTQKEHRPLHAVPRFSTYSSGECWLFWSHFYGDFAETGTLYEYTIYDLKSRIACSRLYSSMNFDHFIDLLTAVAIPVAQSLKLDTKCWCVFDDSRAETQKPERGYRQLYDIAYRNGFDVQIHALKNSMDKFLGQIHALMQAYTKQALTTLMPLIQEPADFRTLKFQLQNQLREYNMSIRQNYNGSFLSPLSYHASMTRGETILPVWAYMEREY